MELIENFGLITLIVASLLSFFILYKHLKTGKILDPKEQGYVEVLRLLILIYMALTLLTKILTYLPKPGF